MGLYQLIKEKQARIGIIGMGYVGLPLILEFAHKGFPCIGFDIDREKVELLNKGISYIKHISPQRIKEVRKNFRATTDFKELKKINCIIICVPTPLGKHNEPDLSFVKNTTEIIAKMLQKQQLIILESTTYPGTTTEVVKPILEKTGKRDGKDFYLAYSPEREDPGNPKYTTSRIPKVVGSTSSYGKKCAVALYKSIVEKVIPVSSTEVAEATKILENIYRAVNIALVNEMKILFDRMNIDIWEVIAAASTKPFGYHPFYPGPGLGGHCIPIDPFYLTWKSREYGLTTRFIELAGEINTYMPYYVIEKLTDALNQNKKPLYKSKLLILGVAYKKDVDDYRESPSLKIINLLKNKGALVDYNDPYIPEIKPTRAYPEIKMKSKRLTSTYLKSRDAVLILTDHSCYNWEFITKNTSLIIDTRGALYNIKSSNAKIVKA